MKIQNLLKMRYIKRNRSIFLTVIFCIFAFYCFIKIKDNLENEFLTITVKTTFKNHNIRVTEILDTWFQLLPKNIYFITDVFDPDLYEKVNGNLINTTCGNGYQNFALGCKLNHELNLMIKKNAKWSCHFDDDNYVNIPILKKFLSDFNSDIPFYLGRTATYKPTVQKGKHFWFATGGAGFCLSNAAIQMIKLSVIKDKQIEYFTTHDNMPDDMALGYIMEIHKIKMTEMVNFFSQYDKLDMLPLIAIRDTPIFSFKESNNTYVNLPYFYDPKVDPFKFKTLHCFLFPDKCCKKLKRLGIDVYVNPKLQINSFGSVALISKKF